MTCVCGIAAYFILVDLPERGASFLTSAAESLLTWTKATQKSFLGMPPLLTAEEASLVHARIERDRGDSEAEKLTWKKMIIYAKDWKIWEFSGYVFLNVSIPLGMAGDTDLVNRTPPCTPSPISYPSSCRKAWVIPQQKHSCLPFLRTLCRFR